jgi:hypothetical protein
MKIEILGEIENIEIIAFGRGVRDRKRLFRVYGRARWRKLKGDAWVQLLSGATVRCELHWYEAHGIGRREFKIKRLIEHE